MAATYTLAGLIPCLSASSETEVRRHEAVFTDVRNLAIVWLSESRVVAFHNRAALAERHQKVTVSACHNLHHE